MRSFLRVCAALFALLGFASLAAAQTLVIGRGSDGNSFDPPESQSFEAIMMADFAFDGLVRYDGNTLNIVPALAESWETSEDGLTWTFRLRRGVRFHDGTPFNADAVVFSLERQRDRSHPFHRPQFARWIAKFPTIERTEKVDDYTVRIVLNARSPTLLTNLAFYVGYIVSPTAVQRNPDGFRNQPVGTGPFRFVRSQRDNFTEYQRNNDYWRGRPTIERVIVRTIPDNNVRLLALSNGEIQIAYGIGFNQFSQVQSNQNLRLHTATSLGISLVSLNVEQRPFDDVRVRRAVAHAIDRERIRQAVFFGQGELADQILPPGWFGHVDNGARYAFDPERARALLAEAGFPNGFRTTLMTWAEPRPYLPSPRDAAALIKSDLARVGIEVDIQTLTWNAYLSARGRGNFGMALGGYISSTLDPDGLVMPLFHSSFIRPNDGLNWARWRNAEVDAALQRAGAMYDEAERTQLYQAVSRTIMEESPVVFFNYPPNAIVARREVQGLFIHPSVWVPVDQLTIQR